MPPFEDPHDPADAGFVPMFAAIVTAPLPGLAAQLRGLRRWAGANPLRWAVAAPVAAVLGFGLAIYLVACLGVLASFVGVWIMCAPLVVVAFAGRAVAALRPDLLGDITRPPWWNWPDRDGDGRHGSATAA